MRRSWISVALMGSVLAVQPVAAASSDQPRTWSSDSGAGGELEVYATGPSNVTNALVALPGGGVAGFDGPGIGTFFILDAAGRVLFSEQDARVSAGAVSADGTTLWVVDTRDREVRAHDVATGATGATIAMPDPGCIPTGAATTLGVTYVVGSCSQTAGPTTNTSGRLWRISGSTLARVSVTASFVSEPQALVADGDVLWTHDDGVRVARLDVSTEPATVFVADLATTDAILDLAPRGAASGILTSHRSERGVRAWSQDLRPQATILGAEDQPLLASSPASRTAVVGITDGLVLLSTSTLAEIDRWTLPGESSSRPIVSIDDDGVAHAGHGRPLSLSRVDTGMPEGTMHVSVDDWRPEIGQPFTFTARLFDAAGTPRAGVEVKVRVTDATNTHLATLALTTDEQGGLRFTQTVDQTPTPRFWIFSTAGTPDHAALRVEAITDVLGRESHFAVAAPVGSSPAEYGVELSWARFDDGTATKVLLSRDDVFADALTGAPLSVDGPLLFTSTDRMASAVEAELQRVLPAGREVVILGGPGAVSQAVEQRVRDLGYTVTRLRGADRVQTAVAIAERVIAEYGFSGTVGIARADGPGSAAWADSVTAGPWSQLRSAPILITPTGTLAPEIADFLEAHGFSGGVVFGGSSAISPGVFDQLRARIGNVNRVSGPNRSETSAAVAGSLFSSTSTTITLVIDGHREDGWAYGLASAGLAGDLGAPILLTTSTTVSSGLDQWLCDYASLPQTMFVLGGDGSLIDTSVTSTLDEYPC